MPEPTRLPLDHNDRRRYSRHLILPRVGPEGQERLKNSRVLVVGAGGLGSPASLYLAAAGVGRIGLMDSDEVEESNLQRQVLHGVRDVGRPKTDSGKERLQALNPLIEVETFNFRLAAANAFDVIGGYDLVLDGTDNFPTRYLANDACVILKKPYVYGSVFRFEGQASVFGLPGGPCYRCFFAEPPPPGAAPPCGEAGVLGVLPGIIGCIQAAESIKLLLGERENSLSGRLLLLDAWTMRFRELRIRRDPSCPLCGDHPEIRSLIDYEAFCGIKPEPETDAVPEISASALKEWLEKEPEPQIIDVREPQELCLGRLPGALSIPLGELERRAGELDPTRTAVLI
ncbi:MAG: molybdopterin-synthase adenylyltransferase MoeB, partial [Planctomycetota bacterium]|nr:molybdopterin-synthase adenylyltransferase MoeB [Planctomycetota bacterium]